MSGEHRTIELPTTPPAVQPNGATRPHAPPPHAPPPPDDKPAAKLLGELTLPAELESVPRARRFSRSVTVGSDIGHVGDDTEILVSELVTNAVRHVAIPGSVLLLRLLRAGSRLRVEVHDQSAAVPRARPLDLMDETGRGWFLVAIMADRHGTDHTSSGKSVWCELHAWPPDANSGH
ncbi:anti-sigma regulatory factor (Ser/Thr protein kinase) [Actinomadura pelletieri DSM 43383]|uniref:Anti-sigma regulatory factor (Ser/Thr protein kinase) n=1 Tax=Actinomadura pelletieri DSM 43383 TaxID=1120940 RepID=A0A495QJ01_9ACTN|nr:ATP-binding protein [Actinomadura pelletieri]RKS72142.1 anti-sigma regulatory factor (Ser/Thr protein kinase) [Actinomadura pelletieri DSM 43383]